MKQRYLLGLLLAPCLARADALSALGCGLLLASAFQVVLVGLGGWLLVKLVLISCSMARGAAAGWTLTGTVRFLSTLVGVAAGAVLVLYLAASFVE